MEHPGARTGARQAGPVAVSARASAEFMARVDATPGERFGLGAAPKLLAFIPPRARLSTHARARSADRVEFNMKNSEMSQMCYGF